MIERARGIYSFSHLTFHDFFTARNIALSRNSQQAFQQLVCHMEDKSWQEVFFLTVGILPNADDLVRLMKQQADALLAKDIMIWWQANGQAWTEQLRAVMIKHRDVGHNWQFNDSQKKLLQQ